jgi:hypothetical protein
MHVNTLIYLDALVPQSDERGWELMNDSFRNVFLAGAEIDGVRIVPPPGLDERTVPHPLACFLQRLHFTSNPFAVAKKVYVYCSNWDETPFEPIDERLKASPEWADLRGSK